MSASQRRTIGAEAQTRKGTAVCALALAAAVLLWPGLVKAEETLESLFARFDTNGDGVIDRTEYELNKVMVIVAFDKNRDDHLDPSEVNISAENFAAMDKDGDGRISGFEFVESKLGKFETLDSDSDGVVTMEELRAYVLMLRN